MITGGEGQLVIVLKYKKIKEVVFNAVWKNTY
ncbi:MAG: hypothetical protein A4E53_04443 [Pelotomaculum sp. PtaB.Bin104]|nr:MAG: hypothetical protein A4E53_04443 [Pelotomaculum sp. PtaB.Bin104]